MKRPDEKAEITRKILSIAGEGKEFRVYDCMYWHLGAHFDTDWEEVCNELADSGYLYAQGTGFYDRTYKLAKGETMEKAKKIYKVVKQKGGGLVSALGITMDGGADVAYKEGKIAYAPQAKKGLSTFDVLEDAILFAEKHKEYGNLVVHEATALGLRGAPLMTGFSWTASSATYPAILLGKEVWREKPKEEPKFKAGDTVVGIYAGSTGEVFTVDHITGEEVWFTKGTWLFGSQIRLATEEETRPEPKFKVGDAVIGTGGVFRGKKYTVSSMKWNSYHYTYDMIEDSGAWEENLELAPTEEWKDVTQKCEVKIMPISGSLQEGCYLTLYHDGRWLMEFGNDKVRLGYELKHPSDYKMETAKDVEDFCCFRIFKKV